MSEEYRELFYDDVLQRGDQFYSPLLKRWIDISAGVYMETVIDVVRMDGARAYRRPISWCVALQTTEAYD